MIGRFALMWMLVGLFHDAGEFFVPDERRGVAPAQISEKLEK